MIQVSSQGELQTALTAREPDIEVVGNFFISSQINILYDVTIHSSTGNQFSISKSDAFFAYMFRISNQGNLNLRNIILDGNQATHPIENTTNRALFYITGGTLSLGRDAILQNNHSYSDGGAIYMNGATTYENHLNILENAIIRNCDTRTNGGGVMVSFRNQNDSFTIGDTATIEGNTAATGGGIQLRVYQSGVSATLRIGDNVQIIRNTANNGGGIYFSNLTGGNTVSSALMIEGNTSIKENIANNYGGGIFFNATTSQDTLAILNSVTIEGNTATSTGGGIYIPSTLQPIQVRIENATISNNQANIAGGLYYLSASGGNILLNGAVFTNNKSTSVASGSGGAIWARNTSTTTPFTIQISNTTFTNNTGGAQGGAFYCLDGAPNASFTLTDSRFENNQSGTNGGAILYAPTGDSNTIFTNIVIQNNVSGNYGGGIYFVNSGVGMSNITMNSMTLIGNQATAQGGALRLASGSGSLNTTIQDSNISNNIVQTDSGGGIWNGGANATLTLSGTTEVQRNETVTGNGGGIYFNSENGVLTLQDNVKIEYNLANRVASDFGNHGGGISVVPGTVFIRDNVSISNNQALLYGGGISTTEDSKTTVTGGFIANNTSKEGGGVYVKNSTLIVENGVITNNSANTGGGIYNDIDGTVYLNDSQILNQNTNIGENAIAPGIYNEGTLYAEGIRSLENGIYIENRNAVVKITNSLDNSHIQLDNSNYVTPNEEGNPIVVAEATSEYPLLTETDLATFIKPPYEFENWYLSLYNNNTQIVLLKAYQIIYENLKGANHVNPLGYTRDSLPIILSDPSYLPNYRFLGWYDSLIGGNQVTDIPIGTTGNIVLYARWEKISNIGYVSCIGPQFSNNQDLICYLLELQKEICSPCDKNNDSWE